jgi:hypothetical protein
MTKTARTATVGAAVMAAVMGWSSRAAASEQPEAAVAPSSITVSHARVRAVGPRVAAVLIEAAAQSKTFGGLVDRISTTDGIVYVVEGDCRHGVRACLLPTMTMAGPNRVLRILVDPRKSDRDLMGSIGHELQHAVEVLTNRMVTDNGAMVLLFKEMCDGCGLRFETDAAIRAGSAVRGELLENAAAGKRRE